MQLVREALTATRGWCLRGSGRFLRMNGYILEVDDAEATNPWWGSLEGGELDLEYIDGWLREHVAEALIDPPLTRPSTVRRYRTILMRCQALLAYPLKFHRCAGCSGCVLPKASVARTAI